MADIYRPSLRLRPSEQRSILVAGDLVASVSAMGGAIYFWYQYSLYKLIESGLSPVRAERLISIEVPFWFYLLPLVWLLLMVEFMTHTLLEIGEKLCEALQLHRSLVCWHIPSFLRSILIRIHFRVLQ